MIFLIFEFLIKFVNIFLWLVELVVLIIVWCDIIILLCFWFNLIILSFKVWFLRFKELWIGWIFINEFGKNVWILFNLIVKLFFILLFM